MTPLEKDHEKGLNGAIAAELRAERSAQRITFDRLEDLTEVPRRTLIRVLNGERAINMAMLELLCEVLDVPMSEISRRAEIRLGGGVGLAVRQDLSDPDFILAASDRDVDAEVEAWEDQP